MNTFATLVGLLLLGCGTYFLVHTRGRLGRLILWGSLVDLGLVFCALGAQTLGGGVGALLTAVYALPARLLAWLALQSLLSKNGCPTSGYKDTFVSLQGTITTAPWTTSLLVFALVAALGVSPFGTPEGRLFALYALANQNILIAALTAIPCTISLWLTVEAVMNLCFNKIKEQKNDATPLGVLTFNAPSYCCRSTFLTLLALILVGMGFASTTLADLAANHFGSSLAELPNMFGYEFSWTYTILHFSGLLLLIHVASGRLLDIAPLWDLFPICATIIAFIAFCFTTVSPEVRLFGLIAVGFAVLVSVYSFGYIHGKRKPLYNAFLLLTFAAVYKVFAFGNAGALATAWEIMSWASCLLIAWEQTHAARRAAVRYLVICGAGAYLLIPALFALAGPTLSLHSAVSFTATLSPSLIGGALLLAVIGFAAKAGLVPLHSWLPTAHPEAPSPISAPLSGVLTKTGLFGIFLVMYIMLGSDALMTVGTGPSGLSFFGGLLVAVGIVTMMYGEWMALKQDDIKRMLAYSTIGQIGEIVAVLGLGTWLALTSSLLHVLNHAIMKDLLFLGAGALILRAGSRTLSDMAGIVRFMPITTTCMAIGLVSIMGLPPLNGFVGKYLMIVACIQAGHSLLAVALLIASLIGAMYYMRILRTILFDAPSAALLQHMQQNNVQGNTKNYNETPLSLCIPLVILAALCLILGLVPQLGLSLVTPVTNMLVEAGRLAAGTVPDLHVGWELPILLPMAGAILPFLHRNNPKRAAQATATVLVFTAAALPFFNGQLDTLSFTLALSIPLMGALNMLYARGYMSHSHKQWRFYIFFLFMSSGLLGVATSQNIFGFFTFWEIMSSWALYFVIAHEETREAVQDAFKYFLFNIAGAACLFLGIGILVGIGGASKLDTIRQTLLSMDPIWSTTVMGLLATGFVLKAAQLCLRIDWQMHPNFAPTPVSGYISSVLLKIAVFGLAKLFLIFGSLELLTQGDPLHQGTVMYLVAWAGALTLITAALKAMVQEKIKMIFIWSTVSQIGYMVLGVALGTSLGVAGGLVHLFSHMLFKDLLFLTAGAVMFASGREYLRDLGGLGRTMPVTMSCFAIAALAAAAIPPTNGFLPKWMIYQALMEQGEILLALISLAGSAITLAYLARALHVIFLGHPNPTIQVHQTSEGRELPKSMLIPMVILASLTLFLGFFPGLLLSPVNSILSETGLNPLDISLVGITSGSGTWNALAVGSMAVLAFGGAAWFLRSLMQAVRVRHTAPHSCGVDIQEAFGHRLPPENIFQAFTALLRMEKHYGLQPFLMATQKNINALLDICKACNTNIINAYNTLTQRILAPFWLECFTVSETHSTCTPEPCGEHVNSNKEQGA